jgi:methylenetetrahydrofolate reductase (NADPH)
MKIADIFDERMSFSFEVFPPKADQPMEPLLDVLNKLYGFQPDFISCTYGAGGSNKGRNVEVCHAIKDAGVECMTHFTCIGNTKEDIRTYLQEYLDMGIENVLAMRGDLPVGWEGTRGDFSYANDLISFISEEFPQFSLLLHVIRKTYSNPNMTEDTHFCV